MPDLDRAQTILQTALQALEELHTIEGIDLAAPTRMAERIVAAGLNDVRARLQHVAQTQEHETESPQKAEHAPRERRKNDADEALRRLTSLEEWDWMEEGQVVVVIDDFLVSTGLAKSRRDVGRLAQQCARLTLVTKNSTFAQMTLRFGQTFALWPGEEVMLGRDALKIRTVEQQHAKA